MHSDLFNKGLYFYLILENSRKQWTEHVPREEDSDGYDLAVHLFVQRLVGYECFCSILHPLRWEGQIGKLECMRVAAFSSSSCSFKPCIPALVCFIHF